MLTRALGLMARPKMGVLPLNVHEPRIASIQVIFIADIRIERKTREKMNIKLHERNQTKTKDIKSHC